MIISFVKMIIQDTLGMSYRGCFAYPVWMQMRMSGSSDIALSTTSYPALRQGSEASVNIQAAVDSAIYLLPWENLNVFWETDMDTQRLGRTIAETMFSEIAQRLYGFYDTPEQRYIRLMQRCPRIQERLTLKEIASFLGVTPETVSRIRKHLLFK